MKLDSFQPTAVENGNFVKRRMGISHKDQGKLITVLRDYVYKDKLMAPIREYSTNAVDAHIEAGIPHEPILVKLPNDLIPTLCIRDFGHGLNEDDIFNVFAMYGNSTKDCSNDQAGMYGIGCKSAFAYTDSFVVVSHHGGKKSTYMFHTADSVEGDVAKMHEEESDERTGIEIQIPVKKEDINHFVKKCEQFFKHFDVTPKFEGNSIEIKKIHKVFKGDNWYIPDDHISGISMGNVFYPIDVNTLINWSEREKYESAYWLIRSGVVLVVPIGSIKVSVDREGIQNTPETKKFIIDNVQVAVSELNKIVVDRYNSFKTNFDKKCFIGGFTELGHEFYHISHVVRNTLRNSIGDNSYYLGGNNIGAEISLYTKGRGGRRGKVRKDKNYNIKYSNLECSKNYRYILNDGAKGAVLNRVTALIEQDKNYFKSKATEVYVIDIVDSVKFNEWKQKNNFDIPLTKLSDLPVVKCSDIYGSNSSGNYVYNPLNSVKLMSIKLDCGNRSFNTKSKYFESFTGTITEKTPYVVVEKYQISEQQSNDSFISGFNDFCKHFGCSTPLIALRKSYVEKLNDTNLIPLEEWIGMILKKNDINFQNILIKNRLNVARIDDTWYSATISNVYILIKSINNSHLNKYIDNEFLNTVIHLNDSVISFINNNIKSSFDVDKYKNVLKSIRNSFKEMQIDYPIMSYFTKLNDFDANAKNQLNVMIDLYAENQLTMNV